EFDHADVKIHPPVLTLTFVIAAFLLNWLIPFPVALPHILKSLGVVLVLAGLTLAFLAVREFGRAHTTLDPHGSVKVIVSSGPYRFSRNPIYLGFVCALIGLPLALGTYWGAMLSPLLALGLNALVIRREEAYLEKKFGEAYARYKSRVRRWV
ncbi:MAG: isoprenylcysteine carboxylmethyltransferase family protein, partial [Chloroflexota bacterium]